jgi:hypothetical protein
MFLPHLTGDKGCQELKLQAFSNLLRVILLVSSLDPTSGHVEPHGCKWGAQS